MTIKRSIVIAALACVPVVANAAEGFVASDVPGTGIRGKGKVVISNDRNSITAYRFFGNIREALVKLRSARITAKPFGAAVYNSTAPLSLRMPEHISSAIADAARTHGVDPRLVAAVAVRESAGNPRAVSPVGACGLMQLMPSTARFLGVNDIFDVRQNVFGGARYLRTLLDTFHGDLDLTLAAYNAGPGAVQKYNGVPPYRETQAYVKYVRRTYEASLR